jgi:hypothetical protein
MDISYTFIPILTFFGGVIFGHEMRLSKLEQYIKDKFGGV